MEEVKLKDLLQRHYLENSWDFDNEDNKDLYETFEGCSETVWTGEPDIHRWFTNYEVVRKFTVGGKDHYFFEDTHMSVRGVSSRGDCGWVAPYIDDMVQVFPKEVLTTVYVTKDKLQTTRGSKECLK